MRSQDGSHAAQFAFDAGDTPLASWCTVVVDVNYANNVFIYRTKMNLRELLAKSRAVIIGVLPAIVPSWYQFPPGTKLDLIAASPTHKVQ
jgi:hypothetical protein